MPLNQSDVIIAGIDDQRISLPRVLKRLHLWDCQHCGKTLLEGPRPSLTFNMFGSETQAALYHPYCREADWVDPGQLSSGPWSTYALGSLRTEVFPESSPTLILNPTMEAIYLSCSPNGVWMPIPLPSLTVPRAEESFRIEPVRGSGRYNVRVHYTPDHLPSVIFESQVPEAFFQKLISHGSALMLITHLHSYNNLMTTADLQLARKAKDSLVYRIPVK